MRVLIAAVFIPAMLFCFYSGGLFLLLALWVVIFGLSAEFGILPAIGLNFWQGALLVAGAMAIPAIRYFEMPICIGEFVLIFSAAWFLLELVRPVEGSLIRSMAAPFVLVLFGWIPLLAFDLYGISGYHAVLPLVLVWVSDTSAYFAGHAFGKRKMSPRLSPNKTWAGFIGGVLGAVIVGVAFWLLRPSAFGWHIVFFALPAGVIAILGDLFESKMKRSMSIKDSSDAIPGHGGFWDRFDSWLFVQLWAWIYFGM